MAHLKADSKYLNKRQVKMDNTMSMINNMVNSIYSYFLGPKNIDKHNLEKSKVKSNTQVEVPESFAEQSSSAAHH